MPVTIKRAYEKPGSRDGLRILVDGLWPRGVSKADLKISAWEKAIAPSKALRVWYGHDPEKWPEFRKRYREELKESPRKEVLDRLVAMAGPRNLTVAFSAPDSVNFYAALLSVVLYGKRRVGQRGLCTISSHVEPG